MREGNIPFTHEKELNDPADPDAALRIETFAHFAKFDAYIDVTVASSECKTHYGKQWSKLEDEKKAAKTTKYAAAIKGINDANADVQGARPCRLLTITFDANGGFGTEACRLVKLVAEDGQLNRQHCIHKIAQAILNGTGATLAKLRRYQRYNVELTDPSPTPSSFLRKGEGSRTRTAPPLRRTPTRRTPTRRTPTDASNELAETWSNLHSSPCPTPIFSRTNTPRRNTHVSTVNPKPASSNPTNAGKGMATDMWSILEK